MHPCRPILPGPGDTPLESYDPARLPHNELPQLPPPAEIDDQIETIPIRIVVHGDDNQSTFTFNRAENTQLCLKVAIPTDIPERHRQEMAGIFIEKSGFERTISLHQALCLEIVFLYYFAIDITVLAAVHFIALFSN